MLLKSGIEQVNWIHTSPSKQDVGRSVDDRVSTIEPSHIRSHEYSNPRDMTRSRGVFWIDEHDGFRMVPPT